MTDQIEPVVSVHGARELNPEAREAVEALIAVTKQQISETGHDGPSVVECAANDRRWFDCEKEGS